MIEIIIKEDGQEKKTVIIPDADHKALNHVVIDALEWLLPEIRNNAKGKNGFKGGPIMQKIIKCRKQMIQDGIKIMRGAGVTSVPVDENELIMAIVAHPDYKNRAQREAEANK